MKVLFVSPEMEPLAKVGGLADVVGALPRELKKQGCDVRVVIPLYRQVKEALKARSIVPEDLRQDVVAAIDWLTFRGEIKEVILDDVTVYLLSNDQLFDRQYIYSTPKGDYPDNAVRFGFLSLGALVAAKAIDFRPDIIHCHDWQTALLPISLRWRKHLKDDPFFQDARIVFTIHNIAYQGLFEKELLDEFGLPWYIFTPQGIEFYGKVNLLKGGIAYSDLVTTVSPTYAEEIKTPQYGHGLEGVLRWVSQNANSLVGILNGIDNELWNPETDKLIYLNYGPDDLDGKLKNKSRLKEELGLNTDDSKPLIGIVSRLAEQKGIDLVVESLRQVVDLGFQLVVLGSGEEKYERMLENSRQTYGENLAVYLGFSDELARKIYAGSDMFLMPSRFEPCGLGQMIALRYGSIPIVRGTGGLVDTIRDFNADKENGNGFVFYEFSKVSFLDALVRAVSAYENRNEWLRLVARSMKEDFSWRSSSEKYLEMYRMLKKRARK